MRSEYAVDCVMIQFFGVHTFIHTQALACIYTCILGRPNIADCYFTMPNKKSERALTKSHPKGTLHVQFS